MSSNSSRHSRPPQAGQGQDKKELRTVEYSDLISGQIVPSAGNGHGGNGNGGLHARPADVRPTGFQWQRLFGSGDPYAEIVWERRTAKITKGDGTVVFEQRDVEVPSFWSQTATDIVASKYFRGRLDTPERETSARQMVNRVADTITGWGLKDGYFASENDAHNFNLDLKWLLINQYVAFNSPVWFNVGVYDKPQCSACFILSVDDTMESILKWYTDEGWIFRGGSGSGTSLSKLRSSKEPLSRGGFSSGPVSFMKGADGVANSIRSGGTTRRAAKMVVLNVDHPDIKDFIYCKKVVEDMSKALTQSGFKNSVSAELFEPYTLLPYQNANNSVRVTDDFMRTLEKDGEWDLKAVTTGQTLETVRARSVMDWIADAAWHSADPGMQYDTTINRWNTAANTGRINASNPCVTGDTLVGTSDGLRRIDELVGTQPLIATTDGFQPAVRVWQTGIKPVYRLSTKYGYSIKVTEDHRVYVEGKGDVAVKDLRLGDKVSLKGSGFGRVSLPDSVAMAVGYAVGDGCISDRVTRGNPQLTFVGGQTDYRTLAEIANSINTYGSSSDSMGRKLRPVNVYSAATGPRVATSRPDFVSLVSTYATLDQGSVGKKFTGQIFELNKKSLVRVLRGLFTADGTVSGNSEKGWYVGLDSASLELLEQVQILLLNFGIKSKLYKNRRRSDWSVLPDARRVGKVYPVKQMHSLRVTRSSRILFEREIGFVLDTDKAEKLQRINRMSDAYRDDMSDIFSALTFVGVEPVYDLTEPTTHHFVANGILVHNCSEYMHLDNSACNLASLNLLKFLDADGSFNVDLYRKAVDTMILAQDVLVDNSSYPTPEITKNAHAFRELGLGYANLGALLMVLGLPYDSDAGRWFAGNLTSLMCGEAYRMSGLIAQARGPFSGFEVNREPMLSVLEMHLNEAEKLYRLAPQANAHDEKLSMYSRMVWNDALSLGKKYGVRNSQVTVLAPTGTIAFLMDCATTGVEPELALVKYKKLVGGGVLKLVNGQVPQALERLGYGSGEIEDINAYILERETIEGAPHLKPEHLAVFDCSFKAANGQRSISYMGHLRMMAAAQPFISGAISKTVNLPSDATVEDIRNVFVEGWRMGLKAIAVYRDGCKSVQPLNTSKTMEEKTSGPEPLVEKMNGYTRVKLPDERPAITHKFTIGGHRSYLTIGLYPETNKPGETFLTTAKEGSTVSGLLDTIATLVSMCLQSGVPLKLLVKRFKDMRFDPAGFTNNPDIPLAKSIVDYMFRYMGLKFLSPEERSEVFGSEYDHLSASIGNSAGTVESAQASFASISESPLTQAARPIAQPVVMVTTNADAPPCSNCGTLMIKAGSCYSCPNCFTTTGVCN